MCVCVCVWIKTTGFMMGWFNVFNLAKCDWACVYICMYVCMYVYTCTHLCVCVCVCVCVSVSGVSMIGYWLQDQTNHYIIIVFVHTCRLHSVLTRVMHKYCMSIATVLYGSHPISLEPSSDEWLSKLGDHPVHNEFNWPSKKFLRGSNMVHY